MVIVLLVVGCQAGSRDEAEGTETAVDLVTRYSDLARIAESPSTAVWTLDGDKRFVVFQTAPSHLLLGPVPPGRACRIRFGLALSPKTRDQSTGVELSVSVSPWTSLRPDRPRIDSPATREVFRETIGVAGNTAPHWKDREVEIGDQETPFAVVLEADPGPFGDRRGDNPGWSALHVVCSVPLEQRIENPPAVIIVSIDTLRRDHLGLYGYDRATSPRLDALAVESQVFTQAVSTAPYTLPSHASLFTGLHPERHGAGHRYPEAPLDESLETLAEVLRDEGYRTVAFTAGGLVSRRFGLDQGFEEWTERQPANLRSTLPSVFDALFRVRDEPFLLFLHTYDVHAPYEQPPEHRTFWSSPRPAEATEATEEWNRLREFEYHRHHELERFSSIEQVVEAYDSGVRWADTHLGLLLDYLETLGLDRSVTLVVTSDHGESLFDKGSYFGHSHTLAEAEIRIPLLIRWPDGRNPRLNEELVQITKVPELLLGELEIGSQRLTGQPGLGPAEKARADVAWGEASHTGAQFARSLRWKVISPTQSYWEPRRARQFEGCDDCFETGWQIYDLARDPNETTNLFGRPERFPPELASLMRHLASADPPGSEANPPRPEGELLDALRALGYL